MIRKNMLNKTPLAALAASVLMWGGTMLAQTPEPTPAPPAAAAEPREPKLEERVGDIEQYFNNLAPGPAADSTDPYKSKLAGLPGPGHNALMMICAALVLFMTLPGLALFYGGLVRKKNVLSRAAPSASASPAWSPSSGGPCGYSLVFGKSFGSAFLGGTRVLLPQGRRPRAQHRLLPTGSRRTSSRCIS